MPIGKFGTVAEAAEFYGITKHSISKAITRGGCRGAKLVEMPRGPVWLIPYPFKRLGLKVGRPAKAKKSKERKE